MRRTCAHKAGFTLIEMLISMAVATSALGLLAATVSRVLTANDTAREHLQGITSLGRLGEQFRGDAHAADTARLENVDGQARTLHLGLEDGSSVEYAIDAAGLRRTLSVDGQVTHREMFVLPGMQVLGWNDDFETAGRLSLRIARLVHQGDDVQALGKQFSIDAATGRRFSRPDGT